MAHRAAGLSLTLGIRMRGGTGAAGAKARGGISNNLSSSSRGVFNYSARNNHDHNSSNASKTAAVSVNINDVANSMHSDSSVTLVSGSLSKGRRRPRRELQRRTTVSSLDDSLHDGVTDSTTTKNCDWKDPNGNRGSRRRPQIDMSRMISICDSSAKNNEDTRATCSDSLASYSYTSSLGEDDLSSIGFVSMSRAPSGHVIGSSSSVVSPTPAAVSLNQLQNYKVLRDNMQLPNQSQHSFISSLDDNSSLASGFSSRGGGGGQSTRDRHTLVKRESRASLDDSLHNDCGKANVYSRPPTSAPASLSPPESLSKMKLSVSNESLHDDKELRSSPKNNNKFRKSRSIVKFGKVDIREFEIEIGDNPSCSRGPAVALGWKILKEESYHHVDRFERVRRNARYKTAPDMVLGRREREKMLLENGFSTGDIAAAVRKIVRIKNQRRQTVNNLPVARFEEIVEVAGRKVKRLFSHKSKSNEITSLFPTTPSTASMNVERNAGVDKSMSYSGSEESGSIDIRSKLGVMTLRKKSPSLSPIVADEPELLDDIFASNTSNHLSSTEALSVSFSTMT